MPRISGDKSKLEGFKTLPAGVYEVRLDGFEPELSKKKTSVNLNPILRVINSTEYNDQRIFDNLNSNAVWIHNDFCHAFGLEMEDAGNEVVIPGEFVGPDNDPSKWQYTGPLIGKVGKVRVVVQEYEGKERNAVDQYYCDHNALPTCQAKHSTNLAK